MCQEFTIDGKDYATLGSLAGVLSTLIWYPNYTPHSNPDWCLCGIDWEKTAEANDYEASMDDGYMFVMFRPKQVSARADLEP